MLIEFLHPVIVLHLLFALVLLSLWRRTTTPRRLFALTVLYLVLLTLSTPAAGFLAVRTLEVQNPPLASVPDDTEAIVVLGTYVLEGDTVRPRPELDCLSQVRTRYAAELYHQKKGTPCWVIASAGKPDPENKGAVCAEMMADLLRDLGVPKERILVEKQSRTTQENAVECEVAEGKRRDTYRPGDGCVSSGTGGGAVSRPGTHGDAGWVLLCRPGVGHVVALFPAQRGWLRQFSARVSRMVRTRGGARQWAHLTTSPLSPYSGERGWG